MLTCFIHHLDGTIGQLCLDANQGQGEKDYRLTAPLDYGKIDFIDFSLHQAPIEAGDKGFYVLPGGNGKCALRECALGLFKMRPNTEYINSDPFMPILGLRYDCHGFVAVVTGMAENACQRITIQNGAYCFYFRITIDGEAPYEPLGIKILDLEEDKSYSAMARAYRDYQLKNGFRPIRDRLNPELAYAAQSVLVRIRMGWKPVPCKIAEQTPENEPPMHVACTFADVEKIIKAYRAAGVKRAEISLVGWNIKGHDGRWPQILPVEESLGGEEDLKRLIKTAKEAGYAITCHTNSTDAYSIAENFDPQDIALDKEGNKSVEAVKWGGGRTYNLCPKRAYEISAQTLPPVADLGFRGLHYVDVITATPPRRCSNPLHGVNKKEAGEYFDRLFGFLRNQFGGSACEGAYDFSLKNCDFILYTSFLKDGSNGVDIVDEFIPFWQLVYHGIVMSNPYALTINSIISSNPVHLLKLIEFGGRPVLYYYSQFVSDGTNWIADSDFTVNTQEEISKSALAAKKQADIYEEMAYLQTEFMESHEKIENNVYVTRYSDGSEVTVDYNKQTYHLRRGSGEDLAL